MNLLKASHIIFGAILTIFSVYAYFMAYVVWPKSDEAISKAGSFGDTFGALTSLFSGLAFAGLILTVLLQRQELKEAREIFRKQKFEDAFYRLLDFHQRNLNAISIKDEATLLLEVKPTPGLDTLNHLLKRLISETTEYRYYLRNEITVPLYEQQLFQSIQRILTPQARYLGTLESIFLLIDQELDTAEDKEIYWKILITQLTSIERKYIFYQCLVASKDNKTRQLIHNAGIFNSIFSGTSIRRDHFNLYEKLHNIKHIKPQTKGFAPHPQSKITEIRRKHKKLIRELRKEEKQKNSSPEKNNSLFDKIE